MAKKSTKTRISFITFLIIIGVLAIVLGTSYNKIKSKIDKINVNNKTELKGYVELLKTEDTKHIFIGENKKLYEYNGYISMSDFYDNKACVSKLDDNGRKIYALIDKNEKEIVPLGEYDYISQLSDGKYYVVEKEGKQGIIDNTGKIIIDTAYNLVTDRKMEVDDGEHVFICKSNDDEYHYLNEEGKEYVSLQSLSTVEFYSVKKGSIPVISISGVLYNSSTCQKICNLSDIRMFYNNIATYDNKYEVYDLDLNLIETVECPNAISIYASSYDAIYSVVEINLNSNATEDELNNKFILYDEKGKVITKSKDGIAIHKIDNKTYFLKQDNSNLKVLNESGNELFEMKDYRLPINYSETPYITASKNGSSQYELFDEKGKLVKTDSVRSELVQPDGDMEKDYMVITMSLKESGYDTYLLLKDLTKIKVEPSIDKVEKYKNHILTSDSKLNEVHLYNKETQVGENISGTHVNQIGTYSIIRAEDTYTVVDLVTLNITFSFKTEELVEVHNQSGVIELTSGVYDLDGNKIL